MPEVELLMLLRNGRWQAPLRLQLKYLTLVYQMDSDCRRLLYVARDRTEESLRGFFRTVPETSIKGLKFICTDMWQQYVTVIASNR